MRTPRASSIIIEIAPSIYDGGCRLARCLLLMPAFLPRAEVFRAKRALHVLSLLLLCVIVIVMVCSLQGIVACFLISALERGALATMVIRVEQLHRLCDAHVVVRLPAHLAHHALVILHEARVLALGGGPS
jgi:hypothetical protein